MPSTSPGKKWVNQIRKLSFCIGAVPAKPHKHGCSLRPGGLVLKAEGGDPGTADDILLHRRRAPGILWYICEALAVVHTGHLDLDIRRLAHVVLAVRKGKGQLISAQGGAYPPGCRRCLSWISTIYSASIIPSPGTER